MLYSVGDVVFVREDLLDGVYYPNSPESIEDGGHDDIIAVDSMCAFCDQPVTIAAIQPIFDGESTLLYRIKEDGGEFWWTDGMFSGLFDESLFEISPSDVSELLF